MSMYRTQKIQPKNGSTLVVLTVARISGCASQKEASLDDQQEHAREIVAEVYDGEQVDYRQIATKGKGEDLSRPELAEVLRQIRTGEIDLLVIEDIGRLVRGTEASRIIGIAVDAGTRVISPNDCIDTNDASWEEDVISACRDHVGHNAQTSKRLKKKMTLRFLRKGESTPCPIAGYTKPENAKSYFDWHVDDVVKDVVLEAAERLRKHLNCSAIADFFNEIGFAVGPYCKNQSWNGAMVRRYFKNPILKGMPERGNMHTVKHHESGKRKSIKNPDGPVSIDVPNLKILEPDVFDCLNAMLTEKNKSRGRKPYSNGNDPLKGVQRKRTRFPGQHATCHYCGRQLVWGGNGIVGNLQCSGSSAYQCWNSVGVSGQKIAEFVVEAIVMMLGQLEGFDSTYRQLVEESAGRPEVEDQMEVQQIDQEEASIQRARRNFNDAIAEYGPSPGFKEQLEELDARSNRLKIRKADLARKKKSVSDLPQNSEEFRALFHKSFLDLAIDSHEFGAMMPKIVPEISMYLVRMIDGGPLYPRVNFKVDLSGAFEIDLPESVSSPLIGDFTVDPFDLPKRELVRVEAVRMRGTGLSYKKIGKALTGKASERVTKAAIKLDEQLKELGLEDPLRIQHEPPSDYPKFRRHLHKRYQFSTAAGYIAQEL